jgi:hypothetical protein
MHSSLIGSPFVTRTGDDPKVEALSRVLTEEHDKAARMAAEIRNKQNAGGGFIVEGAMHTPSEMNMLRAALESGERVHYTSTTTGAAYAFVIVESGYAGEFIATVVGARAEGDSQDTVPDLPESCHTYVIIGPGPNRSLMVVPRK